MKILVVDDDPKQVTMIASYLKGEGHEILTAADGETAYNLIVSEQLDLLITDALIPKLHGFDLIERIRKENYKLPIVLMTAVYKSKRYQSQVKANEYLTKPFKLEVLSDIIHKYSK